MTQTAGQRQISRSAEATGFSPKLLVTYDVRPGLLVYAQAAEGYRPGGFNTAGRLAQVFDAPETPPRRYAAR
ncbi:TonB-dependent receptor domain-containing protein [Caulobacter segnis]